jgi:SAM-dependent methyltransferase
LRWSRFTLLFITFRAKCAPPHRGATRAGSTRVVRTCEPEILDAGEAPDEIVARAYRELTRLHRWLGDTAALERAIRRDPFPVRRILDIGCGHGGVLAELVGRLGVEGIGVDLRPPGEAAVPVLRADGVCDPLPPADVAYSLCLAHHLSEDEVVAMIQNVARSCRRFLLVDLVRHPLPMALFRMFVAPFASEIVVSDGITSIRRAYTPDEFARIGRRAGVRFRHSVSPIYANQTLDIVY